MLPEVRANVARPVLGLKVPGHCWRKCSGWLDELIVLLTCQPSSIFVKSPTGQVDIVAGHHQPYATREPGVVGSTRKSAEGSGAVQVIDVAHSSSGRPDSSTCSRNRRP